ncbi:hypothetical protein Sfum_2459 [Syntrophobacter fumaroxidans MPOB]|uniref:Uncharacterized protein n=1 Tax=Syntrophobacter fumaroxidans (strain DSM 10017 / MPOB) TaxID=335543 RepID=A0LL37_SYNFM|nr:hypothetical protein Sfum_2459 [Syntrophobacter fumaroxidans MPOB]
MYDSTWAVERGVRTREAGESRRALRRAGGKTKNIVRTRSMSNPEAGQPFREASIAEFPCRRHREFPGRSNRGDRATHRHALPRQPGPLP